ncbi:hypothetical protein F5887DRAFT_921687 [Amanita rubescens]|nr:hypothetical protein F5887DRAFT_921687 [Amanita rubescens]
MEQNPPKIISKRLIGRPRGSNNKPDAGTKGNVALPLLVLRAQAIDEAGSSERSFFTLETRANNSGKESVSTTQPQPEPASDKQPISLRDQDDGSTTEQRFDMEIASAHVLLPLRRSSTPHWKAPWHAPHHTPQGAAQSAVTILDSPPPVAILHDRTETTEMHERQCLMIDDMIHRDDQGRHSEEEMMIDVVISALFFVSRVLARRNAK